MSTRLIHHHTVQYHHTMHCQECIAFYPCMDTPALSIEQVGGSLYICVCVCVCVCLRERETDRVK